jgi:hypothetical protein
LTRRKIFTEVQPVLSNIASGSQFRTFLKYLRRKNFDILSYYGYNTGFTRLIKKRILSLKRKKPLSFVIQNKPGSDVSVRLELAEMDTQ